MKAYGRNLRWIENRQYSDELHTGMAMPSSGRHRGRRRKRYLRPLKKMERQQVKDRIKKEPEQL